MPGGHHPRRTVQHRTEVVPVAQLCLTGRQPHPHRQLQRPLRSHRGIHRDLGEAKAAHTPSPVCLNMKPPCASIAAQHLVMGGQRRPHRIGVGLPPTGRPLDIGERNVITAEGAAALMASPRPSPYALQNQTMSPSRDSDPCSRGRRSRRREPWRSARAAAAARCRAPPH